MIKNKKVKNATISLVTILAAAGIIAPSVYYGTKKKKEQNDLVGLTRDKGDQVDILGIDDQINNSEISSNNQAQFDFGHVKIQPHTKVKYLAIGDSITAGFDGALGYDVRGNFKDGKVSGWSFPSFLANYINTIEEGRLADFTNLGLTGSRVTDWLYLLGNPNDDYLLNKEYNFFKFSQRLDQSDGNPFKDELRQYFAHFGLNENNTPLTRETINEKDLVGFKNKLKDANLLTITLGANDFLYHLDFKKILTLTFFNEEERIRQFNVIHQTLVEAANQIKVNLEKLVNEIKKINPDVSINLISYPMPLLRLGDVINNALKLGENRKFNNEILSILNGAIKDAASSSNVNFIDSYNQVDWVNNPDLYANTFYDIHPSQLGYKKMAQDLILKMAFRQDKNKSKNLKEIEEISPLWTKDYYLNDVDSYKQQIVFINQQSNTPLTNTQIAFKVLGPKLAPLFMIENALQKDERIKKFFLNTPKPGSVIKNWLVSNESSFDGYLSLIANVLTTFGIDRDEEISKFLSSVDSQGHNNLYKLAEAFASTSFIDDVLGGIQRDLNELDLDQNNKPGVQKINSDILGKVIKKNLLNDQNLYRFIKEMLETPFFKKNKNQIKKILKIFVNDVINNDSVLSLILGFSTSNLDTEKREFVRTKVTNIMKQIRANNVVQDIADIALDALFDHTEQYTNLTGLSDLIVKVLSDNESRTKSVISKIINTLLVKKEGFDLVYDVLSFLANDEFKSVLKNDHIKQLIYKFLEPNNNTKTSIVLEIENNLYTALTSKFTYLNLLDEKPFNATETILNLTNIGSESFFKSFFKTYKEKNITKDEMKIIIDEIFNIPSVRNFLNNQINDVGSLIKQFSKGSDTSKERRARSRRVAIETEIKNDVFSIFGNFLKAIKSSGIDQVEKKDIADLFKYSLNKFAGARGIQKLISFIADYGINKVGDLILSSDVAVIKKFQKELFNLTKTSIKHFISLDKYTVIFDNFIDDLFERPEVYAEQKSFLDLPKIFLDGDGRYVHRIIDNLINEYVNKPEIVEQISNLASGIMLEFIPLKDGYNKDDDIKHIKKISFEVIKGLTKLKAFEETKNSVILAISNSIKHLVREPSVGLKILSNELKSALYGSIPNLGLLVEIIDLPNITKDDLKQIIDIVVDHIDWKKDFLNILKEKKVDELESKIDQNIITNSKASRVNVGELIYQIINKLTNSEVFHRDPGKASDMKEVADHFIKKLLNANDLLNFIDEATVVGLESQNYLGFNLLNKEEKVEFIRHLRKTVIGKNNELENLLLKFSSILFNSPSTLKDKPDLKSVIAALVKESITEIKAYVKSIINEVLTNEKVQTILLNIIVPLINPSKSFNELPENLKAKTIKVFKENLKHLSDVKAFDGLIEKIAEKLTAEENTIALFDGNLKPFLDILFSNNQDQNGKSTNVVTKFLIELLKTPSNPREIVEVFEGWWVNLVEPRVNSKEYIDDFDVTFNKGKTKENLKPIFDQVFSALKILYTDIFKAEPETKNKIKSILHTLIDDVLLQNASGTYHNEIRTWIKQFILNLINQKLKTDKVNTSLNKLVDYVLDDHNLLGQVSTLLKEIINIALDGDSVLADADTFGSFIKKLFDKHYDQVIGKATEIVDSLLKNDQLRLLITDYLLNDFLPNKLKATFEENEQLLLKKVIDVIFKNITKQELYTKTLEKAKTSLSSHLEHLFNDGDINRFIQQLASDIFPSGENFSSLIDLLLTNDLTADDLNRFIDLVVKYLPFNYLEDWINTHSSSSSSIKNINQSKEENSNSTLELITSLLKGIANRISQSTNDQKTKLKAVAKHLFDVIFKYQPLIEFSLNKVKNIPLIKNTLLNYGIDETSINQLFKSLEKKIIENNVTLASLPFNLVESFINHADEIKGKTTLKEILQLILDEKANILINDLKSLIKVVFNIDEVKNLITTALIHYVSPVKDREEIDVKALDNITNFISKLLENIEQNVLVDENLNKVLSNDKQQGSLILDFLTVTDKESALQVVKRIFNYENYGSFAQFIHLFENNDLTEDDYVNFILSVIGILDFNHFFNRVDDTKPTSDDETEIFSSSFDIEKNLLPLVKELALRFSSKVKDENKTKIKNILVKVVTKTIENTSLVDRLVSQLKENTAINDFINQVGIATDLKDSIFTNLGDKIKENKDLFGNLVTVLVDGFIAKANEIKEENTLTSALQKVIDSKRDELVKILKQLINIVANVDGLSDAISNALFKFVSPNRTIDELDGNLTSNIKEFIKKFVTNLTKIPLVDEKIRLLLKKQDNNKNPSILLEFLKVKNMKDALSVVKKIFDFEGYESFIELIKLVENDDISADEYASFLFDVFTLFDFDHYFKKEAKPSPSPTTPQTSFAMQINQFAEKLNNANTFKYVQKLLTLSLKKETPDKIKNIINLLASKLIDVHLKEDGIIHQFASKLADSVSEQITKSVAAFADLKQEFKTLITSIFESKELYTKLSNLLSILVKDLLLNKNDYKTVNNTIEFISTFFFTKKNEIKTTIKEMIDLVLKPNGILGHKLTDLLVAMFRDYLNIEEITSEQKAKLIYPVEVIMEHLGQLEATDEMLNQLMTFFEEDIRTYNPNEEGKNLSNIIEKNIKEKVFSPSQIGKFVGILKHYDGEKLTQFVKTVIELIPESKYNEWFASIFNVSDGNERESTVDNVSSTSTPESSSNKTETAPGASSGNETLNAEGTKKDALPYGIAIIKGILNSDELKDSSIKDLIKKTVKDSIHYLLDDSKPIIVLKQIINKKLVPMLEKLIGFNEEESKSFVRQLFDFVFKNQDIRDIFDDIIEQIINNENNEYGDAIKSNILDIINHYYQKQFDTILKPKTLAVGISLIKNDFVTNAIAKGLFNKLKLENTTNDDVEIVRRVIKDVIDNYEQLDFVKGFIDEIFTILKKYRLEEIETKGVSEITKAINDYGLSDFDNYFKLVDLLVDKKHNEKGIDILNFTKLINIIFSKSPIAEYSKIKNSMDKKEGKYPLFEGLLSIEGQPFSQTITQSFNPKKKPNPKNLKIVNQEEEFKKLFEKLWTSEKEFKKEDGTKPTLISDNPFTEAIIRIGIVALWYAHESFFQNSDSSLWWGFVSVGEKRVLNIVRGTKQDEFNRRDKLILKYIFGNRGTSTWWGGYTYPNSSNYQDTDFLFMITYWRQYQGKTRSRHWDSNHDLVDEIFTMIKDAKPYKKKKEELKYPM